MTVDRSLGGICLARAADAAFAAFRSAVAAFTLLDEAELLIRDPVFLCGVDLLPVDVPALMEDLDAFFINALRLADAYGHVEAARRFRKAAR